MTYKVIYKLVFLAIIILCIIFITNRNLLYKLDSYHYIKNKLNNDKPLKKFYRQFSQGNYSQTNTLIKQQFDNIELLWSFRPDYSAPVYPYVLLHDVNKDNVKEIYYASNTEYLYEIDGKTGSVLRKFKTPLGVFSAKANLLYQNNHGETFFLGNVGQSLPVTIYSLSLKGKDIKINWKKFIKGQFVEASINKINLFNELNFLILTRDATYSRGRVHLVNENGRLIYKSDEISDVCDLRPSITKDNAFIYGSHDYISHDYSNHIIKKDLITGKTLWKKKFDHDTGFFTPIILNQENDQFFILVHNLEDKAIFLDGKTGKIKKIINNINIEGITSKYIISNRLESNGSFVDFININDFKVDFSLKHSIKNKDTITEHFFIYDNHDTIKYHGFSFDREEDILIYKIFDNDKLIQETKIPLDKINFNKLKFSDSTRDFTGISKLGDIDNDNKLDIFFRVYDQLLRFETNSTVSFNYDYDVHPQLTQDALVFKTIF